jgi:hypothetical protein
MTHYNIVDVLDLTTACEMLGLTAHETDSLTECQTVTWGDANYTLIDVERFVRTVLPWADVDGIYADRFGDTEAVIEKLGGRSVYINLEG